MEKKRLGKGLEDISHFFISQSQGKSENAAIALEESSKCHTLSVVDPFNPHRSALLTSKIALEFCRNGLQTLLVDTDPRFPSIAFILGFSKPGYSLRHYFQENYKPADILYTGPFGLKLLAPHLDVKGDPGPDKKPMSLLLDLLNSIENETDIIILRQYKIEFLPLVDDAIFFVPAFHTGMIMAYREIKAFVSGGDRKNAGLIITDAVNENIGARACKNIAECLEEHCGISPFLCTLLPDISEHSIAYAVEGMVQSVNIQRDKIKKRESFFGRVKYQITNNNLTGNEISRLLS